MTAPSERVNFIILFQGRTGSSYLIDALARHPDIIAEGEWLVDYLPDPSTDTASLLRKIHAGVLRFWKGCPAQQQIAGIEGFYTTRTEARAVGFKTKVRDVLDLEAMKHVLEAHGVRAIIMQRRNLIKQTASRLNAARLYKATQEWNLLDEADRQGSFQVDLEEFNQMLRRVEYEHRALNAFADYLRVPKLELEYEDLLVDRDAWFHSVFTFLGIAPRPLQSSVLKNTKDDLREVITNFDEVKERYRGTAFEPMFEEHTGHSA